MAARTAAGEGPAPDQARVLPAALDRRFEAAVFDWDGTAVPDRSADAGALSQSIERLSRLGFDIVVVSGTHVGNVDGQLHARPRGPGRLYLCLNRGSEVFAVGRNGPVLLARRDATAREDATLTAAADLAVARLVERGLRAEIVAPRLNRRKIDLIPEPAWSAPPKAQIGELLAAVEERLAEHGFAELSEVVDIVREAARAAGLHDPRVTSDVKHVELGLTDKSDSARWALSELIHRGIAPSAVLVAGDEFGPVGGLAGSDSLMLVPEAAPTTKVSVGVEPNGVPAEVLRLQGGPPAFGELLHDQLRRRRRGELPVTDSDPEWTLTVDGLDPALERSHAALLTVADGSIGTNGAPLRTHEAARRRVLVANTYVGDGAASHLLEGPRWAQLPGGSVSGEGLRRVLDLRSGLLCEQERIPGQEDLRSVRFSSAARPGTVALRTVGPLEHATHADPLVPPGGHVRWENGTHRNRRWIRVRTNSHGASAAATDALHRRGRTARLDRLGAFTPSREPTVAVGQLIAAEEVGFERLLCEHRATWGDRWDGADIRIAGDADLQRAVRFALFHLQASAGEVGETALGPRGLTGPGYRGHVFWDTDVFVLPFLAATRPEAARALLEYRLRRLPAARREARAVGRAGARFPWESARSGRDVTPSRGRLRTGETIPVRTGELEEHIVADVAWAASFYVDWSGDEEFRDGPGLELLVETARYWASRIRMEDDGRGHIGGVIGPDEYHEGVDDNAYTNVMARWNLRRAVEAVAAAPTAHVDDSELTRWTALAEALVDGFSPETGVYEQFAGFFDLEPLLISDVTPRRPVAAEALLGHERLQTVQVVKQADVLMLHHLVPDEVAPDSLLPNLSYYEPRTAHGSSLSPGIHAALFARAGLLPQAVDALELTSRIDLDDLTQTTAAGLHFGSMGSLWQAFAFGFAGLRPTREALRVDPRLPASWQALEIRFRFRGVRSSVLIERDSLTLVAASPVSFLVGGNTTPTVATPAGRRLARLGRTWKEVKP